ncbi:MAG: phosphoglycerate dehydrogenase [Candidatus Cloacimonetes bacterium]|nr:phosphoglycerate dehydrogenase [Candidatus Cloacimonadota bacterium]
MTKILITDTIHNIGVEILRREGFEIVEKPMIEKQDLLKIIPQFPAIITRSQTGVDKDVIDAGVNLKVIGRAAIGVDNIDLDYATKKGILIVNVPSDNVISAAEHTFALLLAGARNLPAAASLLNSGKWSRKEFEGVELYDKSIGIIGLGKVGSHVAKIAAGFGMKILAYDPYIASDKFERFGAKRVGQLMDLIRSVDILTVHTPKTSETVGMLDYLNLKELKRGSIVINCARGGIIEEEGLLRLVDEGHIRVAGVDVFAKEPAPAHPMHTHKGFVCTPHLGASTEEAQYRVAKTMAIQMIKALKGEIVDHPVNMPFVEQSLFPAARSYCVLAEKMGRVAQQLTDFNPSFGRMQIVGMELHDQKDLLVAAFFKGYFEGHSDQRVNYINSVKIARDMGLELQISVENTHDTYTHLLKVEIYGDGSPFRVAGTIFGREKPRIVELNGYPLDWEPEGFALVVRNRDKPGVIGRLGTTLGEYAINIARWELGRKEIGGEALAVISTDQLVDSTCLSLLKQSQDILSVTSIRLG